MASLLADSMKPQVFSTATSAPSGVARDVVPRSPAQGHHLLGVHQILGAAQGYKGYFVWHDVSLQYFLILYQKFCHLLGGKMSHCLFGPFE